MQVDTVGRVVVVNFVSLDGVVQSPLSADEDPSGGFAHGGWVPPLSDATVDAAMADATVGAAGLLLGRRSYDILSAAWADADDSDPAVAAMNRMPKYVVTSSADGLDWANSHRVEGGVGALRREIRGDLLVLGSAALVQGLAGHDLVDEYRLLVFPLVLGSGKRMFGDGSALAQFDVADSQVSSTGVVITTYRRRRG